eukprot:6458442-Amphidinium_carterae.1
MAKKTIQVKHGAKEKLVNIFDGEEESDCHKRIANSLDLAGQAINIWDEGVSTAVKYPYVEEGKVYEITVAGGVGAASASSSQQVTV